MSIKSWGCSFGTFLDKLICRLNLERVLGCLSNQYFKERPANIIANRCWNEKSFRKLRAYYHFSTGVQLFDEFPFNFGICDHIVINMPFKRLSGLAEILLTLAISKDVDIVGFGNRKRGQVCFWPYLKLRTYFCANPWCEYGGIIKTFKNIPAHSKPISKPWWKDCKGK